MLSCQRDLFDIPSDVTYLDAAGTGPLPRAVRLAGEGGVAVKSTPWESSREPDDTQGEIVEGARLAAAQLVGASKDDVAIVCSASYGVATAGLNLPLDRGSRILILEQEHASQSLEWMRLARSNGGLIDVVPRPSDGDWTSAVLEHIDRPGAPPIGIAALTPVHWTDGALVDLGKIAPTLRRHGAALVVDATQAAGVLELDVKRLEPDFLVFPTYKWLLGSYSLAFLYVAPARQQGRSLEQNASSRREMDAASIYNVGDLPLKEGGRRYDMGELDWFVGVRMARAALAVISGLKPAKIEERLRYLTDQLADRCRARGLSVLDRKFRAPHIFGLRFEQGTLQKTIERLAKEKVFVSGRRGFLRVSPHIYNDDADIERFVDTLVSWGARHT
jgi:selenocysteine lyase/cysteine desulfurase